MGKVRVNCFSLSADGFGAGPNQSLERPFGDRAFDVVNWMVATRTFKQMIGQADAPGSIGVDDEFAAASMRGVGAWILGRNMFAPSRGPWTDDGWKGWWGPNPPYHTPTFILSHHPRAPIEMEGGTTFHFVTEGIDAALARARAAAGNLDVRIGGGVATVRQFLSARLIDEMHLAVSGVLVGEGEHLFRGVELPALGYTVQKQVQGERAMHVLIGRNM